MDQYNPYDRSAPGVTIAMLWAAVRRDRRLVRWIAGVTVLIALLVALFATPVYEASAMLAPPPASAETGGLSELAGQFGGLAALAGLGMGGRQDTDQSLVILTSEQFLRRFIDAEGVAQALYAKQWDPVAKRWHPASGPGAWIGNVMQTFSGWLSPEAIHVPSDGSPDPWQVYHRFEKMITVDTDKRTHIITLSVRWKDPVVAAAWVNALVKHLNSDTRGRAVAEANASLGYVADQLAKTQVFELRQALYHIAENEQKRAMVANTREEFALRVLAKAEPPHERSFPKRSLLVLGGLIGGLILGVLAAIARAMLTGTIRQPSL
jgi:uncharacterized protein involved in exopolysaccharide biosynthesis